MTTTIDAGTGPNANAVAVERRARLRATIAAHAPSAPDALAVAVSDPEPLVRAEVAYQVGQTRHPQAQAILAKLSTDAAPVVRVMVVEGLAALGDEAALATLRGFAIADPSDDVRGAAVHALDGVAGADAEAALTVLSLDPVAAVRDRATASLARRHAR